MKRVLIAVATISLVCSSGRVLAQLPLFEPNTVLRSDQLNAMVNQINLHTAVLDHTPRTLQVDCSGEQTITQALTTAFPGDTIQITGTCHETATLFPPRHTRVTFDGQGIAIVDGGGGSLPVIDVVGVQGVTIRGLTVQNGSSGIRGRDGAALTLDNVTVQNNLANGIDIQRNSTATFTGTIVSSNNGANGLAIAASSSVFADSSSTLTTRNNTSDGLGVGGSSHANLLGTTTTTNNGNRGIALGGSSIRLGGTTLVQGNGGVGVSLNRSSELGASGTLNILSNANSGLLVNDASVARLFDGTMVTDGNTNDGIQATGHSRVRLAPMVGTFSIQISNNGRHGISFFQQSNGRLESGTTISGNTDDGIHIQENSSVVVTNTSVTGNRGDGMDVDDGSASVSNSTITGHGTDVRATFGSRLTLNGNTIGTISCDGTVLSRGAIVCP